VGTVGEDCESWASQEGGTTAVSGLVGAGMLGGDGRAVS
jgi:hypothetical protein